MAQNEQVGVMFACFVHGSLVKIEVYGLEWALRSIRM